MCARAHAPPPSSARPIFGRDAARRLREAALREVVSSFSAYFCGLGKHARSKTPRRVRRPKWPALEGGGAMGPRAHRAV